MSRRRWILFAALAFASLALADKPSTKTAVDFTGQWTWKSGEEQFDLTLTQEGSELTGRHAAIGQGGAKVDEAEAGAAPTITGTVKGVIASIEFKSAFPDSTGGGKAQLTMRQGGATAQWRIVSSSGEHYLPKSAVLKRVRKR